METEIVGVQEVTIPLRPRIEYQPRHKARLTFREWAQEILDTAPPWALLATALGIMLIVGALFVALWVKS